MTVNRSSWLVKAPGGPAAVRVVNFLAPRSAKLPPRTSLSVRP